MPYHAELVAPMLNAMLVQTSGLWNDFRGASQSDPYLLNIGQLADKSPGQPYAWKNGLLCYNNRVVIPPTSTIIKTLLQEYHDTPAGGH